jgi:hypothetical protein
MEVYGRKNTGVMTGGFSVNAGNVVVASAADKQRDAFKCVDSSIACKHTSWAYVNLQLLAAGLDSTRYHELFSISMYHPQLGNDLSSDQKLLYVKIALKMAKVRSLQANWYMYLNQSRDANKCFGKAHELLEVVNSVEYAGEYKDIKLELGEWYLSCNPDFIGFEDEACVRKILEEAGHQGIPDDYPKLQAFSK